MKKLKKQEQGFTLVELAIVLVIIGLLLGAVLKGQQLIYNAKVKRVQNQIKEMEAAFYTYYDKYGYYPGDDPQLPQGGVVLQMEMEMVQLTEDIVLMVVQTKNHAISGDTYDMPTLSVEIQQKTTLQK